MTQKIITLDVRPDFHSGAHPCDKIQNALSQVRNNQTLRLLVPFEPVPLFEVARTKGLTHDAKEIAAGDWEVLFSPAAKSETQTVAHRAEKHACGCGCSATEPTEIVDVDARGLEPPQPMVKILEALGSLIEDEALSARTDRRPVHLYPLLEARGFIGESKEQSDGSFITHIRRS